MDDLIKNIFSGSGVKAPGAVEQALFSRFGNEVLSVEWSQREDYFEAVFYYEQLEHIARFLSTGYLLEYRVNLSPESLPSKQKENISTLGEVMNVVEIHRSSDLLYEVIVRDSDLVRSEVIIDRDGVLVSSRLL